MRKLLAVVLAVIMLASVSVVGIHAAVADAASSAAGKATVTLVGLKGDTVTQTYNVGDVFKATVYLNAAEAIGDTSKYGISSVSASQTYDTGILESADAYNKNKQDEDYGMAEDIDAILPILNKGGGSAVANLGAAGTAIYNGSKAQSAGYKFVSDTSALVVLQYKVIAAGSVTIGNTAATIALSDKMLTRIVDRGVIKNDKFTSPVALELVSSVATGVSVSGAVKSFLSDSEPITLTLANADNTYTIDPVTGNNTTYAFDAVAPGTYTLTVSKKNHVTREYKDVAVSDSDVTLDVKICPPGDINGNGVVNTQDVSMANQHYQKLYYQEGYAFLCGDVNHDGKISTADVSRINQHYQKLYPLWT